MGMTIDEVIKKENEIAADFQRVVDTHMVDNKWSIEEMYCDDTEVIEEHLAKDQEWADYHNQIAEWLEKYQKIEEIWDKWHIDMSVKTNVAMSQIGEVIKDGNVG